VFGRDVVASYFTRPIQRVPPWLYVLDENQSLLATLLRLAQFDPARGTPLAYPPFVLAASVTFGVTCWFAWRLAPAWGALGLATMVPAALLLYPQSLEHYAMLNLVPLLYLWTQRERLRLSAPFVVAWLSTFYAISRYDAGSITVIAHLLEWVLLVALCVRVTHARAAEEPTPRAALAAV
jgi:hypothetical protein